MDLSEAYGGKFVQDSKKGQHTRIKNLEPEQPQGTSILPEDLNPRPSSVPRTHVIDERPRPRPVGRGVPGAIGKSIGQILNDSVKTVMGSLGSHGSNMGNPEIYLVQFHISRDDCHTICLFLLVFIISFLMSARKQS